MDRKTKIIIIELLILILIYISPMFIWRDKFTPNTNINNIEVSNLTKEEAIEKIKDDYINNYKINLIERNGSESIDGKEISLNIDLNIDDIYSQNKKLIYLWPINFLYENNYDESITIDFDENKLTQTINDLNCIKNQIEPQSAYIEYNSDLQKYEIIKENNGAKVDIFMLTNKLKEAILNLEMDFSLEENNCYINANKTSESASLNEMLNKLNKVCEADITYIFGDAEYKIDSSVFHDWIETNDLGEISLNYDMINAYVTNIAKATNTAYTERLFKTTIGKTVNVTGPYGYRMDVDKEIEQLTNEILSGTIIKREPIYNKAYGGVSRNGNDYGDTYVEVDLTNQKVYMYVDGKQIVHTDCVTGNVSKGWTTPPGIFPLTYKKSPDTLDGPGYSTFVNFWMPFNGGIGLHDATWRSSFGGNIYKTNGSHGCINLPYSAAKTIYENAFNYMPIICYN